MFRELLEALQPTRTVVLCKIEEPVLSQLRMLGKGLMLNELNSKAAVAEHMFKMIEIADADQLFKDGDSFYKSLKVPYFTSPRGKELLEENERLTKERQQKMEAYLHSKDISPGREVTFNLQAGQLTEEVPR
ncbi:hypothetical protein [Paenibacillus daejeonensis]|uniref:hypothetical protein n=1 Tax=Paenibacillus daejeonensis TaxID=135193 RepID=UPI0003761F53|nr:hypothetical protein [Paenibacillus daejeonensis]